VVSLLNPGDIFEYLLKDVSLQAMVNPKLREISIHHQHSGWSHAKHLLKQHIDLCHWMQLMRTDKRIG